MKGTNTTAKRRIMAFAVPLLAAVLIACAGLGLLFAIHASQAKAAGLPITVDVEKEQAMAPPALDTLLANDLYNIRSVYAVEDISQQPLAGNTVTAELAAENAVRHLEKVYGAEITGTVFVEHYKYEGMRTGQIDVYANGPSKEEARFLCYLDAATGELQGSTRMTLPSEQRERKEGEDPFAEVDHQLMENLRYDLEFMRRAEDLIHDYYLGDRQLVEMELDGIQWVFSNTDYQVQVDCKVHVEPGESYVVNFGYPGYQVVGFSAYPLGWHSALWGYRDPGEANEYPGLDGSPSPRGSADEEKSPALPYEIMEIIVCDLPDMQVTVFDAQKGMLTIEFENVQVDKLKQLLAAVDGPMELQYTYAEGQRAVLLNLKEIIEGKTVFTEVPIPPIETAPPVALPFSWRVGSEIEQGIPLRIENGKVVPLERIDFSGGSSTP